MDRTKGGQTCQRGTEREALNLNISYKIILCMAHSFVVECFFFKTPWGNPWHEERRSTILTF